MKGFLVICLDLCEGLCETGADVNAAPGDLGGACYNMATVPVKGVPYRGGVPYLTAGPGDSIGGPYGATIPVRGVPNGVGGRSVAAGLGAWPSVEVPMDHDPRQGCTQPRRRPL